MTLIVAIDGWYESCISAVAALSGHPTKEETMMKPMPQNAKTLLKHLQRGSNVAVPSVYLHSLAFSDHAHLYLENAAAMCLPDGAGDFRIFSALFNLRHGLELWFKCLHRNQLIDRFLARVFGSPDKGFEELMTAMGLRKKIKDPFQKALCCLRNVLVDGMKSPDVWGKRASVPWADKALQYLRENPGLDRQRFAAVCQVRLATHSLNSLWDDMGHLVESFYPYAQEHAQRIAVPPLGLAIDEIHSLCQLLHHYDPGGDAFRYPSSLNGTWNSGLPHLDLGALGKIAQGMADTVLCISSLRSDAYDHATVAQPSPFLALI